MVAGRSPFSGTTLPALIHAVLYDTAPVLTGSPAISALDRVVHRALAKKPDDRYPTIGQMSSGLEQVLASLDGSGSVEARTVTRLAVLPFRLLKPDPEIEYLRSSLADAITTSLSGLESLVIRSTLKSSQFAEPTPDLNRIASELAVDAVLTGSILPSNGRLRVSAQLMSVPAGDVLWSYATIVGVDAVFELHESLAGRTVEALPLTSRDHARKSSARPASAKAFELYLRGMQLRMETSSWRQARVLFDQSVTLDPAFAPAWAERGRLDRVFGKYENQARLGDAEVAFQRALALDPDSGAAHYYYAQLESTSAVRLPRSFVCSTARGSGGRSPSSGQPSFTRAVTADCSTIDCRARACPPPGPDGFHQRAPYVLHARRLRASAGRGPSQQRSLRDACAWRDGPRHRSDRGRSPRRGTVRRIPPVEGVLYGAAGRDRRSSRRGAGGAG